MVAVLEHMLEGELVEHDGGGWRLLYREALYERHAPARRALLQRRCAERMEALFATNLDDVAPGLAYLFELGPTGRAR